MTHLCAWTVALSLSHNGAFTQENKGKKESEIFTLTHPFIGGEPNERHWFSSWTAALKSLTVLFISFLIVFCVILKQVFLRKT